MQNTVCASTTEVSPSGSGLRILALGKFHTDWNNHDIGIEVYSGHTPRFLTITGDTFSKTYIMTGFRIGWCVANKDLITTMDIFQQNSVTNVPAFVQLAALAAITGPQDHVEAITAKLQAKRDKTVAALNAMPGIECPTPDGSFYVFPDISHYFGKSDGNVTIRTADDFCEFLLLNAHVGTVGGDSFGAPDCFRISYAASEDSLRKAIGRIAEAVKKLA